MAAEAPHSLMASVGTSRAQAREDREQAGALARELLNDEPCEPFL